MKEILRSDRRHFRRVHFDGIATLSQLGKHQSAEVVDLSLKGALVDNFENGDFDLSQPVQFNLNLGNEVSINMELVLAYRRADDKKTCGFRSIAIDIDSITHLRRLIELNLGSVDANSSELTELFEQKIH